MQNENNTTSDFSISNVQNYLYLGYLLLLILGIIRESLLFHEMGLNYIQFSSIPDIILSPIALIISNPKASVSLVIILFSAFLFSKYVPLYHKKYRDKTWYRWTNIQSIESLDTMYSDKNRGNSFLLFAACMLIGFYTGIGTGNGKKVRELMSGKDKLEPNTEVFYSSGETKQVVKVAQNSLYFFYIDEETRSVIAAPISTYISGFRKIENKKEKETLKK